MVGRAKLTGFQREQWNSALTSAEYPDTSMLPARYRHPQPVAAAPPEPAPVALPDAPVRDAQEAARAARAQAAAAREQAARARKKPDTPPGFQF